MFGRLVEQRWAVCAVLSDRSVTKLTDARTLELRDDFWQLMEDMAPALEALKCATTVMSADTEVSISNTYPITFSVINTHLKTADGDGSRVAEFKSKVRTSSVERMKVESEDLTSTTPMVATMLDPRHKHLGFLVPVSRISAHSKLLELPMAEHVSCTSRDDEATTGDDVQVQGAALQRHTSAMTRLLGENYTTSCNNDIEKEVDMFLKDPSPLLDSSPTEWWKVNEGPFPRLANVAR
ncbi:uncharacterized protein LOC132893764 [Neoarius graeffei]|uniref:uncharacterized protein LOC132893764 n=1 Tax=Neoarius graeffei TaxID=443677 RepID=UPI00298CED44|nr:uncharacterized protein LOC132893764 [Neoarius graeffei]